MNRKFVRIDGIKRCDDDERKEDLLGGEKMWEFIDVQAAGVISKAVGF